MTSPSSRQPEGWRDGVSVAGERYVWTELGMRVLVIEDDDSVRAAVRRALLLGGYEVIQAPTGREGLLSAQSDVPDAIVLDLGLPDIDGVQVCRTLRDSGNRTPILM